MNRLQVARVALDSRLQLGETSRDPILLRVVHFTLNGCPVEEEVPDNLKSYYFKKLAHSEQWMLVERNTSSDPSNYPESVFAEVHLNHPGISR